MIIMSFVEMMVGTAQNIIKLFVAAALYRKLLKVHLIFWFDLIWFGHYNTAAWDGITLALCPSNYVCGSDWFDFLLVATSEIMSRGFLGSNPTLRDPLYWQ